WWLNSRPQLLWPPVCWAVLAFVLYAIYRYFTSDIEYVARREMLNVLVYAFLFFAILNNLHRQESVQIISYTLLYLAMGVAFYALYQFLADSDRVWGLTKPYPHRGSGTYICPNHLGGFLEMLLPLGLAFTITGRAKLLAKIFLGYAALVIAAGIAVTLSRGTWLATGVALGLFFLVLAFRRKYRVPALCFLVVLAVGGLVFFPKNVFVQMRVKQAVLENTRTDRQSRMAVWTTTLRMWEDHPWLGVGPGHFEARFRNYRPEGVQANPAHTHNDYLNTLADYGIIGTSLIAAAFLLLGVGIAKTWPRIRLSSGDLGGKSGSNKFAFVFGATLGLVAILVHSIFDFNLHIPANAILAVTLMALITSHLRFATEQYWFRLRLWSKVLATIVVLAGAAYLAPQTLRLGSESVWLYRADHASKFSKEQVEALTRAFAIEPKNPQTALAIGEAYRRQSQEGGEVYQNQEGMNYRRMAELAIEWFDRSLKLNPWDSRPLSGIGWSLDWLGRQSESEAFFARAEELDPNNYYNLNNIGQHYIEMGNYAAAKPRFERSLRLEREANPIAQNNLLLANARLQEAATNELRAKLNWLIQQTEGEGQREPKKNYNTR
ncbi:MAG TPA: O-antigen ligase family protein, partial [Clostridia bacterium]|nr:O-antigen ligase family protein [Clostridia bacterium]